MTRLIIYSDPFVTKAAKINDEGKLCVFSIRKKSDSILVGNIYKGIVTNTSRSLDAAFVDIGIGKNAFLPLEKKNNSVKPGDVVVVQVFKPIISTKGPKVTTSITLPGNNIVLLRNNRFVGISRQIKDPEKISFLKSLLEEYMDESTGFIARTASQYASREELINEIHYLKSLNRAIDEKIKTTNAPALIYEEEPLPIWVIREYCDKMTNEIYIDDRKAFELIRDYLERTKNPYLEKLKLYTGNIPIFKYFGVHDEVKKLEKPTVPLKHGAYITIEKTEALFAIDVNAGKCQYRCDVDEAVFEINKEAAYEIFNQITLRDLGGIIVVDFIDMEKEEHKKELEEIIKKLAETNKRETHVSGISPFGLVEVSRRKNDNDIFDKMFEKCERCASSGLIKSTPLICSEIYETLRYSDERYRLTATANVVEYMHEKIGNLNGRLEYSIKTGCNPEDYALEVIRDDRKV